MLSCYHTYPVIFRADRPGLSIPVEPEHLTTSEQKRKQEATALDKHNLLYTSRIVTDQNAKMLEIPVSLKEFWDDSMEVAKTAPVIDFGIVPAYPLFFGDSPRKPADPNLAYSREWSNWSQATVYPQTGKFYSTLGDTDPYDGHLYVVEYDPAARKVKCMPELHKLMGTPHGQLRDAKLHGYLDFIDGPNLWFCTYWTLYPEPAESDFATGYKGGHIVSLNVLTGDLTDYGVPVPRVSWPYHRIDKKRKILYAVGFFGEFLVWDMSTQKPIWAGYPPKDMTWWWRAMLIDEKTGNVYSSYIYDPDNDVHLIKYNPQANRFTKLEMRMPHSSADKEIIDHKKKSEVDQIRANTLDRGPDGLIWGVTKQGELFTLNPDNDQIVAKGINWCGMMRYTCAMDRSPGGRYIYYCPGAHGMAFHDGSAVVQYDTKTGKKKVLAFLFPYYSQKYGYLASGTFSIKLDEKGQSLFCLWNGGFYDPEDSKKPDFHGFFGNAAITLIHIPESERAE